MSASNLGTKSRLCEDSPLDCTPREGMWAEARRGKPPSPGWAAASPLDEETQPSGGRHSWLQEVGGAIPSVARAAK